MAQYPHMDIVECISANIQKWMKTHTTLNSLKAVSKQCRDVSFGTLQRARDGSGNITARSMEAIAAAFGKTAIDLISDPEGVYPEKPATAQVTAKESPLGYDISQNDLLRELFEIAVQMPKEGQRELVGAARVLAYSHRKTKTKSAA